MEYGWRANMKPEKKLFILRKALVASQSIKEEDLKTFLSHTSELDVQEVANLLIEIAPKIEEEEMKRILKYIPEQHQDLLETILFIMSTDDPLVSRMMENLTEVKNTLYETYKTVFEQDQTLDKENVKEYLNGLTRSEKTYLYNILGTKEVLPEQISLLKENMEETKKTKH